MRTAALAWIEWPLLRRLILKEQRCKGTLLISRNGLFVILIYSWNEQALNRGAQYG